MSPAWLSHDDDRVWTLVWLGYNTETDNYTTELGFEDSGRALRSVVPELTAAEIASTLREITAALDIATQAEADPVGFAHAYFDDATPFNLRTAGEELVDAKRAEAFTCAELAVSLSDARTDKPANGHTTRVVTEHGKSHAVCGCSWHSDEYASPSVAVDAGRRHESKHDDDEHEDEPQYSCEDCHDQGCPDCYDDDRKDDEPRVWSRAR